MKATQTLFQDTIYALSSGGLPAGLAVVRLSGPHVQDVLQRLAGGTPKPRELRRRTITNRSGEVIDRAMVVYFPGPGSYTGEDCAEIHLHGGKAIVAALFRELAAIDGLRQAEGGEFTRRAFLNGKHDLTSAEALVDLIEAETEAQRRLAMENADGRQFELYERWRLELLRIRAMIEAELDFSDEDDVSATGDKNGAWEDVSSLAMELREHLKGARAAQIVRDGFRVVISGPPNAGKSSLVNALSRRDVAIVTPIAGTTRDLIETPVDFGGYKVILVDTAGLRESEDPVERIGVMRAKEAAERADLILLLAPPEEPAMVPSDSQGRSIVVATKADLRTNSDPTAEGSHLVSTLTGEGLDRLIQEIVARASDAAGSRRDVLPARLRHVALIEAALGDLQSAVDMLDPSGELRAEELRLAERSLGRIVGSTDVEDVLGEIFSRFCIGK